MSEEEKIIENIKQTIEEYEEVIQEEQEKGNVEDVESGIEIKQAIQGLLELYTKQKQNIDRLQKENENLNKKNKRYEKYLKNKDIEHEKVLEYIETEKERDYISKDKVRENIDTKINIVIDDRLNSKDTIQIAIDKGIEELLKMIRQELLGE